FGHPSQFPQLFADFGLDPFVYWRGNGIELDTLSPLYRWCAPDGSAVRAWHLGDGYFGAAALDADDVDTTVERLVPVVERLGAGGTRPVLLMNGFDHLPADEHTSAVVDALAQRLDRGVTRGVLDDARAALPEVDALPEFHGELVGGRITNL